MQKLFRPWVGLAVGGLIVVAAGLFDTNHAYIFVGVLFLLMAVRQRYIDTK